MGMPIFAEQRISPRRKLSGLLPGKLTVVGATSSLACKPVDISAHGLGIVSMELLAVGAMIALKTPRDDIMLEVVWGKPDFGKRDLLRYGLVVVDSTVNLETVFAVAGCLK